MTGAVRAAGRGWRVAAVGLVLGLVVPGGTALADPVIRPRITAPHVPQSFTLVVPDEHQPKATLTMVELYPPPELAIESFAATEGWKRDWTIVSRDVTVQKATWTRASRVSNDPYFGADPTPNRKQEQATVRFRFVAVPSAKTSYPVEVRETYSDGKVIHWTGTRSYAFPASPQGTDLRPPIMLRSTGTRSRPYGWIAGIGAAVVLVCAAAFVAVRARASRRPA